MIARNFIKYPEALRFQREMFSNGYHNSPRIMRLVECIFDWTPTAPDWWTAAKAKARALAKAVKKSIADFFKSTEARASVAVFKFQLQEVCEHEQHHRRPSRPIQHQKRENRHQATKNSPRHDSA